MRIEIENRCSDFDSYRAVRVKSLFNCESGANFTLSADMPIEDGGWKIGVIVGPSGSGKTSLGRNIWPDGIDLIVAAHSYDFIGEKTRLRARWGGIGYHPSLLPLHRGRDAIRWALKMRERVTGGTVYRLSNKMDGGEVLAQRHVFIGQDDTEKTLWEHKLQPLGIELLVAVVTGFLRDGYAVGYPQDESIATFEPAINVPPAYRPDLLLLEKL